MRQGEVWVLTALFVFLAGGLVTAFKLMPDFSVSVVEDGSDTELSVYDQLQRDIQPYHFGNVPREAFSGDTTVWVVDLDYNMYSLPQVNLRVTRVFRNLGFTDIVVRERSEGGIVFKADFPNGQPLEIQFTSP